VLDPLAGKEASRGGAVAAITEADEPAIFELMQTAFRCQLCIKERIQPHAIPPALKRAKPWSAYRARGRSTELANNIDRPHPSCLRDIRRISRCPSL
jgi:hypothetical protein